jgi:hypothetical protein
MGALWNFLGQDGNRKILGWIGGGLVVVAGAIWTIFVFFWTPHAPPENNGPQTPKIEATSGGVAIGGDVTGSRIETGRIPDPSGPVPAK